LGRLRHNVADRILLFLAGEGFEIGKQVAIRKSNRKVYLAGAEFVSYSAARTKLMGRENRFQ
jgi:hypothetical protein